MTHLDHDTPHRDAFQLERVVLFTDAVFAIALTLLVIEIKIPDLHGIRTNAEVWERTLPLTPKFVGFFVAFFVIAIYWTAHHRVFRFVVRTTPGLLWLNLLFLLNIVLMPFTAAYQGEYPFVQLPWVLYALTVIFTGLMQLRLQQYIRNPAHGVALAQAPLHPDLDWVRPLVPVAVFVVSIVICLFNELIWCRVAMVAIGLAMVLYQRRYRQLAARYEAMAEQAAQQSRPGPAGVAADEAMPVAAAAALETGAEAAV